MQFNILERTDRNMWKVKRKWEERVGKQLYVPEDAPSSREPSKKRWIPKELQELLNIETALCPQCKGEVCKPQHLREVHNILIPDYSQIMTEIEARTEDAENNDNNRADTMVL